MKQTMNVATAKQKTKKEDLKEEIERKRRRIKKERRYKIEGKRIEDEKKRQGSQERRRKESRERRITIEESSSTKGERTLGIPIKNSRNDNLKPQRTPMDKKKKKPPIDNLLGKMTMVVSHAHFYKE